MFRLVSWALLQPQVMKMPAAFDACRAAGGKIRTIVPEPGKYIHVCYPPGGGPSVSGEVKTAKAGASVKEHVKQAMKDHGRP